MKIDLYVLTDDLMMKSFYIQSKSYLWLSLCMIDIVM